jgi:hypothetical protein
MSRSYVRNKSVVGSLASKAYGYGTATLFIDLNWLFAMFCHCEDHSSCMLANNISLKKVWWEYISDSSIQLEQLQLYGNLLILT